MEPPLPSNGLQWDCRKLSAVERFRILQQEKLHYTYSGLCANTMHYTTSTSSGGGDARPEASLAVSLAGSEAKNGL
jgi:hypothetical protein